MECGVFQLFGYHDNKYDARCTRELNPGLPWKMQHPKNESSFHQQTGLKF